MSTEVLTKGSKHCDDEKCERTNKKVICLPNRHDDGKHCRVSKTVELPRIKLRDGCQTFEQKPIRVEQKSVYVVVKEGCHDKKADEAHVDIHFKEGQVEGGKFKVFVKKPEVHVEPQRVHVEIVEGPSGKCEDTKVHVHVDKPRFCIKDPEVEVKFEKSQCRVRAPEPIVCTKYVRHHKGSGRPQVTATFKK